MESLESRTGRYEKCSAVLIYRMSHQVYVLRSRPQSEFQRRKVGEIVDEISAFSKRAVLKLARKKIAR